VNTRLRGLVMILAVLVFSALAPTPAFATQNTNFGAALTGDQVVLGPGAPDGSAVAAGTLWPQRPSHVCIGLGSVQGAVPPFTAHIHHAPRAQTGPIVATVQFDTFAGACGDIDKNVLQDITRNFDQYYLDIHTDEFPDGAMRGQLQPR
jgi:CHRD domain